MCKYVVYESMNVPHPVLVVVTYVNCHLYKSCAKVSLQQENFFEGEITKIFAKVKLQ